MAVKIMIQFDGKNLTIPINPENLKINQSANNTNIDIVGLGQATRKGEPGLETLTIESFFPGPNSYFYTGVLPKTCIDFIKKIWKTENKDNNVAKIVTTGLPDNLNMYFVIESFSPDVRAGEEEDVYFELKIKRYVPYGAKIVKTELTGLASARAASPAVENVSQTQNTYTVQSGDCLWNIAKAATGNGANWPELYNLNKSVIGSNPNLIYPGQVLVLPAGWSIPGQVPKLKNVSGSGSKSSGNPEAQANESKISTPAKNSWEFGTVKEKSKNPVPKAWQAMTELIFPKVESKPVQKGGATRSF